MTTSGQAYFDPRDDFARRLILLERAVTEMKRASSGAACLYATGPAGSIALTGADQDITGLAVTITKPGVYAIFWATRFGVTVAGGTGDWCASHLAGTGWATLNTGVFAMLAGATISGGGTTPANMVQGVITGAGTLKLQAKHNGGTLTASVLSNHSSLLAIRTGPC